jgi:hypothetical protein
MSATVAQELAELRRANTELRQELDAALAREATLTKFPAAIDSVSPERIEQQSAIIDVLKWWQRRPVTLSPSSI